VHEYWLLLFTAQSGSHLYHWHGSDSVVSLFINRILTHIGVTQAK
jgi:hypothetical protein